MNKIRSILKIAQVEEKIRGIASAAGVSRTAVENTLGRISGAQLTLQQALALDDTQLREIIYPLKNTEEHKRQKELKENFPHILKQLGIRHMTLQAQWEEYRLRHPDGYAYSRFCDFIRQELSKDDTSFAMEYAYGQLLFIDYAGDKHYYIDRLTGRRVEVNLFVAILPASQYTFAEFTLTQKTTDWINASENALRTIGGTPAGIVPDCAKAVVKKADYYESEIQFQYQQFADYYRTIVFPARPGHPRDKALVESAVNNLYRWVYPRLCRQEYYSLAELNTSLRELMTAFNNRTMRLYRCSRNELFEAHEKPLLKNIPAFPFEYKEYQAPTSVKYNCHLWLDADKHYYSVPYKYSKKNCSVLYDAKTVEIYCENVRIATHQRDIVGSAKFTTNPEHLKTGYQEYLKWTPERFQNWGRSIGPNVESFVCQLIERSVHFTHCYRTCMGLLNLNKPFGNARLDRACEMVLNVKSCSLKRVQSVLEKGADLQPENQQLLFSGLPANNLNIRYS